MQNKITIITPVYNCEDSIIETLQSVVNQTFKDWEHILIDDGSKDNSNAVIKEFIEKSSESNRYRLLTQSNADQLNAILSSLEFITTEYVFILHADDILGSHTVLENALQVIDNNSDIDVVYSDLNIMDKNSIINGIQKVNDYQISDYYIANQLLQLGRNQHVDIGLFRTSIFKESIAYNYLTWNTPHWLDLRDVPKQLNIKKIEDNMISYRVFDGNYINNEIGVFNVINGELRTAIRLLKYYNIPNYRIQNILSRIFKKIGISYSPFFMYSKKESSNYEQVIKTIINIRYPNYSMDNKYFNALIDFYSKPDAERTVTIKDLGPDFKLYKGKDIRFFANDLFSNKLPSIYDLLLTEMSTGFSVIECKKEDLSVINDILLFLNISNKVKVEPK